MRFIYLFLILNLVSSCITRVENKGYSFELSDPQLVQEGVSNKEAVMEVMGSPTVISDFNNRDVWIYYSEEIEKFLFYIPKIKSRKIFVVRFDRSNTVKYVRQYDLTDEKNLKFAKNYTKIRDHEEAGFFKSIISNIGQVRAQ